MTTSLQVRRARDVFVENDVIRIAREKSATGLDVAGAAWLAVDESVIEAHRRSLSHAASLAVTKLAGYVLWLLAGSTAWQPDSRIARHRKLWGSLEARGLATPFGRAAAEGVVEGAEGIRFFGALQLGLDSLDAVVAILEAEPVSHLVALKVSDEEVATVLAQGGWARSGFGPSAEVLASVCSADGTVFWPVGGFDDREAGCVAFAKWEVLNELLR